jgi:hypothetical protein
MTISGRLGFWSDDVGCFCHEAVGRALLRAFDGVTFEQTDLAYAKYDKVSQVPSLNESAWQEYLRNGPRYSFFLKSGVTGVFSRYEITFHLPSSIDTDQETEVRKFFEGLILGSVKVEITP